MRCAIYTRKSSEEGLEQDFNSLHAQREACEAYIRSQRQEGWRALPDHYDDGGYSGGTLERPALHALLGAVKAKQVDVIVIYKIDRLTRSLTDFAKLAELFEAQGVSFVSVTQQFNTTTSMGRLMLNVLLSFAQFEREVTGERIRDKIAASKKKGIWMGGTAPLGYDNKDRSLMVNPEEAEIVRNIFRLYLECGTVTKLKAELEQREIRTKAVILNGKPGGQRGFARGHLYKMLSNPIYLGKVRHKGTVYPGQHEAIIDQEVWAAVQEKLAENIQGERRKRPHGSGEPYWLAGVLVSEHEERFVLNHANKKGRRYRYYVTQPAKGQGGRKIQRLPAIQIEQTVQKAVRNLMTQASKLAELLDVTEASEIKQLVGVCQSQESRCNLGFLAFWHEVVRPVLKEVIFHADHLIFRFDQKELRVGLGLVQNDSKEPLVEYQVPLILRLRGSQVKLVLKGHPDEEANQPNLSLIGAVARAHCWFERLRTGSASSITAIAKANGFTDAYINRILNLAFLAPEQIEGILEGRWEADSINAVILSSNQSFVDSNP